MSRTEPADWVKAVNYQASALEGQATNGPAYLLVENQRREDADDETAFRRFVTRIVDIETAEESSQITINFDPSYQRLELHHIRLVRGGEVVQDLDMQRLELYRAEEEADRLIYNHSVTASYILTDVRAGDIIDYAYTVRGKNPFFSGHLSQVFQVEFGVPVARYFIRYSTPTDQTMHVSLFNGAVEPKRFEQHAWQVMEWDLTDVDGKTSESEVPDWFSPYARIEISSFDDWRLMSRHEARYYQVPQTVSAELKAEIDTIASAHADPALRARAAIDFVQREIRYLGIENGIGGYAPRDPSEVLRRRFGDCKDKTMLLVTMLDRLGIQAVPLLVSTDLKGHVFDDGVVPHGFDHVIVSFDIADRKVFVDPTRSPQIGNLANFEQADFGKGLPLTLQGSTPIEMRAAEAPIRERANIVETFDLQSDDGSGVLTVETVLWGDRADSFLRDVSRKGLEKIQKEYLDFYTSEYGVMEVTEPVQYESDTEGGTVAIVEQYRIANAWIRDEERNRKYISVAPYEITSVLPKHEKLERVSPYATSGPASSSQKYVFLLGDDWSLEGSDDAFENDYFTYRKVTSFEDGVYRENYDVTLFGDHIAAADMQSVMKDIETIRREAGVELFQSLPSTSSKEDAAPLSQDLIEQIIKIAAVVIGAATVGLFFHAFQADKAWRADAVFYPVSATKFLVMSGLTLGLYPVFWTYKNWRWLKVYRGENLMPIMRTIFLNFSNFSLFPKLAQGESNWRERAEKMSILSAIMIFVAAVLGQASEKFPDMHPLFGAAPIIAVLFYLPFVFHVRDLNAEEHRLALMKNSRFGLHAIVAILVFLPLNFLFLGTALHPETTYVVSDARISDSEVAYLREIGALEEGEDVELFYSAALFGLETDGNMLASDHVVSYWHDGEEVFVNAARFDDVDDISLERGGRFEDSVLTVSLKGGGALTLYLSSEADGDKRFEKALKGKVGT